MYLYSEIIPISSDSSRRGVMGWILLAELCQLSIIFMSLIGAYLPMLNMIKGHQRQLTKIGFLILCRELRICMSCTRVENGAGQKKSTKCFSQLLRQLCRECGQAS